MSFIGNPPPPSGDKFRPTDTRAVPPTTGKKNTGKTANNVTGKVKSAASSSLSQAAGASPSQEKKLSPKHIEEQGKLFESSRALRFATERMPLMPANLNVDNINDVYMTSFSPANSPQGTNPLDVVFKPGAGAAVRSEICYGLARLAGFNDVLVPAKKGEASVVSREDAGVQYSLLKTSDGKPVLVNLEKAKDEEFHPDMPKELKQIDEWLEDHSSFRIVEDKNGNNHIVPEEFVFAPSGKNKVTIENVEYKLVPAGNEYPELIKLVPVDDNNKVPSGIAQSLFRMVNVNNPDEEEMAAVLIPDKMSLSITSDDIEETFSFTCMGKSYAAEWTEGAGFSVSPEVEEDENADLDNADLDNADLDNADLDFDPLGQDDDMESVAESDDDEPKVRVYDEKGTCYVVNEWRVNTIHSQGKELYVERNGQQYQVEKQGDEAFSVVGHNIVGMVQAKVANVFQTAAGETNALDIRQETNARKDFYDRIDEKAFNRAFIATIMLRPEDGKITKLDESNVLFQVRADENSVVPAPDSDAPLYPVLIDLDETLPDINDIDPNAGKQIHPLRCGLMGFPHAWKTLTPELQQNAETVISGITQNKDAIKRYLEQHASRSGNLTKVHIDATLETIDKMQNFIQNHKNKNWCLKDLFFEAFPGYQAQWDKNMGRQGAETPELLASQIGFVEL